MHTLSCAHPLLPSPNSTFLHPPLHMLATSNGLWWHHQTECALTSQLSFYKVKTPVFSAFNSSKQREVLCLCWHPSLSQATIIYRAQDMCSITTSPFLALHSGDLGCGGITRPFFTLHRYAPCSLHFYRWVPQPFWTVHWYWERSHTIWHKPYFWYQNLYLSQVHYNHVGWSMIDIWTHHFTPIP